MTRREPLLEIENLSVTFRRRHSETRAVDGVSYSVAPGEIVGVVGESGSGKSVTVLALMGLLPNRGVEVTGQARYNGKDLLSLGKDLLSLGESAMARLRGPEIAMVFQDPISSLNPVVPIGVQVAEVLLAHTKTNRSAAMAESVQLLRRCGIPDPERRLKEYPHQLSGGMRQRALIAMALACKPKLLICDEPTTALDVTIQAQVLELLKELVTGSGTAMIMITHDLGVVAGLCDVVNVMYSGRIVESATRRELFAHPRHRYTEGLLASIPRLDSPPGEPLRPIRGTPRDVISWSQACAFAPRCDFADQECATADLPLLAEGPGDHLIRCVHPAPAEGDPSADDPGEGGVVDV